MSTKVAITPKGTKLPLITLKGNKDYLMGAYRLVWLNEQHENFEINTEFLSLTDEQTIARTTVTIYDKDGKVQKKASATKRETKKDFPDHTEKAESSSCFRALAMLGMGVQHSVVDFDEGHRIVDSPLDPVRTAEVKEKAAETRETAPVQQKVSTFRKPVKKTEEVKEEQADGWE